MANGILTTQLVTGKSLKKFSNETPEINRNRKPKTVTKTKKKKVYQDILNVKSKKGR